ncbi:hypothetical protein DSO57_1022645 [Entomophthora muscae]|uniref:Uncharacterized protein n=1 Tax=Entomophthora muscae TaxID=34485 RepID=A0ACC2SFS2_9FUNG|nr:hypothetical protein DSO57_1022645 [Entomophthora muscae]
MNGYNPFPTKIVDFYDVLGVGRYDSQDKIKKAYRTLAKTWHPDKNPDCKKEIEITFTLIKEAYEQLSDPSLRACFDQELNIYERKYGRIKPNKSYREKPKPAEPKPTPQFNPKPAAPEEKVSPVPQKPTAVTRKLHLTIEEIYHGTTKKLYITRTFLDGRQTKEIIEVLVTGGWEKSGRSITVKSAGDQLPSGKFQDIIFEIEPKPHEVFFLEGNDLVVQVNLSLLESLCGFRKPIPHLSGSVFYYDTDKCTANGFMDRIPGYGMPSLTESSHFYDLLVCFRVNLPEKLTPEQISCLHSVF